MLVLTTMLTSISDDLPKTAGVKYIGRVQKYSISLFYNILNKIIGSNVDFSNKSSNNSEPYNAWNFIQKGLCLI